MVGGGGWMGSRRKGWYAAGFVVALAVLLVPAGIAVAGGHAESFVTFDPAAQEFPEGIALDDRGRVYVSLILLNQIRVIDPGGDQSVHAELAVNGGGPAGIKVDPNGIVYAAVPALNLGTGELDPETRGVYRVRRDGSSRRLRGSGRMTFPNDLVLDEAGNLYATDTADGAVWRIPPAGGAELWVEHRLLEGDGSFGFFTPIGANGIALDGDRVIVGNPERGLLVEIPIRHNGEAEEPRVLRRSPRLVGIDGIVLDRRGRIYGAVGNQNTVVRVEHEGSIETLATAEDGLNQPSALAFGTRRGDRRTLYVANFSIFSPVPTPGVLKFHLGCEDDDC